MVVVDDDYKTYYVMDDASVRAMAGQVGAALDMANEALKNVPASSRA
ncbi:MAG: hypothetical protein GY769_12825 [bacterium]|nr:hypothetical protein [bacterium]